MSGIGKGKSGLGKGGKYNAKRHKVSKYAEEIDGITKPSIRRLARRSGIKRINGFFYQDVRGTIKVFLEKILQDALIYTSYARRKTLTAADVIYALKKNDRPIYGFHKAIS